jgi:hypothetical protein
MTFFGLLPKAALGQRQSLPIEIISAHFSPRRCLPKGEPLFAAQAGALAVDISSSKSRPGEPGFPAKKIGLFQAFEKALLSGNPEIQVRQSGKTVKQTIFCPASRRLRTLNQQLQG